MRMFKDQNPPVLCWASPVVATGKAGEFYQFSAPHFSITLPVGETHSALLNGQETSVLLQTDDLLAPTSVRKLKLVGLSKVRLQNQYMLCPIPMFGVLSGVWTLVSCITYPDLRHFLEEVLCDPLVISLFYKSKGAEEGDFSQAGDLARHSVDIACVSLSLAKYYELSDVELSLALVTALLHEIGKIRLHYNSQSGILVSEKVAVTAVVGPYLTQVLERDPALYEALMSCLKCIEQPQIIYMADTIVKAADKLSRTKHQFDKAFADTADYYDLVVTKKGCTDLYYRRATQFKHMEKFD